jgi:hypothetical protein
VVGPTRAFDDKKEDITPTFKNRPESEKEFITKVGEATLKAVRTSPTKMEMLDYKITDPKANRKLIEINMSWAGAVDREEIQEHD